MAAVYSFWWLEDNTLAVQSPIVSNVVTNQRKSSSTEGEAQRYGVVREGNTAAKYL